MIWSAVKLDNAVLAPPWPIFIKLLCKELEKHGHSTIIIISLEQRPIDLTLRIYWWYHRNPGSDQGFGLWNRVRAALPCFSEKIAFSQHSLVNIYYSDFCLEKLEQFHGKSLPEDNRSCWIRLTLDEVDLPVPHLEIIVENITDLLLLNFEIKGIFNLL